MSGLIVSDLHAHAWSRFATTREDGTNSRFAHLLAVLDQIETYLEEYRCEYLLILGDLFHRRYYVQFSIYTPIMGRLFRIQQRGTNVIALVGNHDIESQGWHSLGPLSLAGIEVVDAPRWIELPDYGWGYFVPYMNDVAAAVQKSDPLLRATRATLFLHYAFDGKVLDNEYAVPTSLRLSDADDFDRIILGHVHSPSVEHGGRVTYVGAPLHFDFGDSGDRFAWLLTTHGAPLRPLPLHAPRFVTTTYPRVPVPAETGFLRVLNTPPEMFTELKRVAIETGWLDVMPVSQAMPQEAIRALAASVMVDETIVLDYVTRHYPDVDDATRARMVEFGLDCLRAAQ